jgi:hypothetical protein
MLARRTGFIATLAAGLVLLGAAFHGMTSVDHELQAAAATPAPAIENASERHCDEPRRGHRGGPEV